MAQQKKHWIILGSGFRGIIASYLLAKQGCKVTLIDRSKKIGGVLHSEEWKGFFLDKGCHLFDNDQDEATELLLEIMDGEVSPVDVKYASFVEGKKTDGVSIPNLESYPEEITKNILWETLHLSTQTEKKQTLNLYEELVNHHGETATAILEKFTHKTHLISSKELDSEAFKLMPYKRIKFLSNEAGKILKESALLDDKIAISSQYNPLAFYQGEKEIYPYRNFYPKTEGLKGFCTKALEKLEKLGVSILLENNVEKIDTQNNKVQIKTDKKNQIEGDYMFWTGSQEVLADVFQIKSSLKELVFAVPMILYYFVVDKKYVSNYTYIHNFEADTHIFRASIPTNYIKNDSSKVYICCEVPSKKDSAIWNNEKEYTDTIWQELKKMELVDKKASFEDNLVFKTPVSYKVPKIGYTQELEKVLAQIPQENIFGLSHWEFSKNNIIRTLNQTMQKI